MSSRPEQSDSRQLAQLRQQIVELKRTIVDLSKTESQADDAYVRKRIDEIFYSVQGFVLANFRNVAFEPWQLPVDAKDWMASHIYQSQTLAKPLWTPAIIGLISRVLVSRYKPEYFFGMSSEVPVAAASALVSSFLDVKSWLQATQRLIDGTNSNVLEQARQSLVDNMVDEVQDMFAKALRLCWTAELRRTLAKIFASAIKLFNLLHIQHAVYHIEMAPAFTPGKALLYAVDTMEQYNSAEEAEQGADRPIEVSVFPGVYKFGNENGENLDQLMIITKARVVLK